MNNNNLTPEEVEATIQAFFDWPVEFGEKHPLVSIIILLSVGIAFLLAPSNEAKALGIIIILITLMSVVWGIGAGIYGFLTEEEFKHSRAWCRRVGKLWLRRHFGFFYNKVIREKGNIVHLSK